MVSWNVWQGDSTGWDALLLQIPDYTVFQSYAWGEHRSHFGWRVYRFIGTNDVRTVAMAQVLVRQSRFGVAVAWAPGGPVGEIAAWNDSFRRAVCASAGARRLYCRLSPMREELGADIELMTGADWLRPKSPMNTGLSLLYAPSENEATRMAKAERNWRQHLRRAMKFGHVVSVWRSPDPDEMLVVYEAMQTHKNLGEQFSRAALVSIVESLGDKCVVVRCDDAQGRLLALRGALLLGNKGWDLFAAATPEARKVDASYSAFWELMRQCASRGVESYDMSGVDPIGNKGVFDFKKGTGARDYRYLGEWEWATSAVLRRAANFLIRRSGRITY